MIKSMTGFGKSECLFGNRKLIIEIKSLNSKFLDINARIPNGYRVKELDIRGILANRLQRGKIDFVITLEESGESSSYTLNKELAKKYFRDLKELSAELGLDKQEELLATVMRMPDVMVSQKEDVSDEEWELLIRAIHAAMDQVDGFRSKEGATLAADLADRTQRIEQLLEEVTPFEQERINSLKSKITKDIYELADQEDVDRNRLEQEIIYYLDRIDITEEKVRLKKHCRYFLETLNEHESQGKKLGFITQEMGREINTLGSKASDAHIQKLVVQMKDELEKIKEQLFNIL